MNNVSTGNTTLNNTPDDDNPTTTPDFWEGATLKLNGKTIGTVKGRGKQIAPTKKQIAIRLSPEVMDFFMATGKGWQSRMDDVLRDYVKNHNTTPTKSS